MNCFPHGSIPAPSRECIHPSAALLCYWSWEAGKLRSFMILTRAPKMPLCTVQRGDCVGTLCSTHMPNLYWIKTHFFSIRGFGGSYGPNTWGKQPLWMEYGHDFLSNSATALSQCVDGLQTLFFQVMISSPSPVQRPHLKKSLERLCCHGSPEGILTS